MCIFNHDHDSMLKKCSAIFYMGVLVDSKEETFGCSTRGLSFDSWLYQGGVGVKVIL